ncbi:hypothetical protein ACFC5X_29605 [Streptomyces sp. NPDC055952]|uniref:hypothetical protein n=1 Tax=Streptomyces sp. NPDC055952 TaxID=3345663 RepID=UPI0035E2B2A9
MPAPPPPPVPPGGETAALVGAVVEDITRRLAQYGLHPPADPGDVGDDARRRALARLRVINGVKEAVRLLEDEAAHAAAASGAGYPEIGQAVSMSRQGARRRWPGLITGNTSLSTAPPTPRSL